jgi:hypothetical protein
MFGRPVFSPRHCPLLTKRGSRPCPVEKLKSSFSTRQGSTRPKSPSPGGAHAPGPTGVTAPNSHSPPKLISFSVPPGLAHTSRRPPPLALGPTPSRPAPSAVLAPPRGSGARRAWQHHHGGRPLVCAYQRRHGIRPHAYSRSFCARAAAGGAAPEKRAAPEKHAVAGRAHRGWRSSPEKRAAAVDFDAGGVCGRRRTRLLSIYIVRDPIDFHFCVQGSD